MYRSHYGSSSGPNLYLPYEYEVPYQQYQTSPWYLAPINDINPITSRYTYGEGGDKGTPRSFLGLNNGYSPVPDSVIYHQGRTGRE